VVVDWTAVMATAELAKIDPAALSDTIARMMILRPMRMIPPGQKPQVSNLALSSTDPPGRLESCGVITSFDLSVHIA
jgi:hypothetical protein